MYKKIIYGIFIGILILIVAVSSFIFIQLNQLKPEYEGNVHLPQITNPVTITWDSSGVVHIRGDNIDDVIFASGFVAAKERLWQMELMRRMGKGELSEVFGDTTVKIDKLFLTLGIDEWAGENYKYLSPESKQWLNQYTNGINAYLEQVGDDLPIEFILMKVKPKEWIPKECLLINRLMAWFLNFNWKADFLYWQLYSRLPAAKFKQVLPEWGDNPSIIKAKELASIAGEMSDISYQIQQILGYYPGLAGSNNWVISPQLSQSGFAMLANDPHLGLTLPSVWMEMHLQTSQLNVAGFGFPGAPGIVIGRNTNIAWGETNGMVDDCDYFVEQVDTSRGVYKVDGQEKPLKKVEKQILRKGKSPLSFTVLSTERGPIINLLFPEIKSSRFLSMEWMGWKRSDELKTFINLATARNWDDFQNALSYFVVPAQNFVYADIEGNIGYRLAGRIPIRTYKNGLLPVAGNKSQNSWRGWIPFEEMPHIYNPERGWIVTANNQIIKNYAYYISDLWEPPYRALRIEHLLTEKQKYDKSDFQRIQNDAMNLLAPEILPVILTNLKASPSLTEREKKVIILLENWDYRMLSSRIAPSVYEVLQYFLIQNIFKDEMGEELFQLFTDLPNFYLRIFARVFKDKKSLWFDDISTNAKEERNAIIVRSFRQSLGYLEKEVSKDLEDWRWGRIHRLKLKHSLGQVALTDAIFNRGPYSVSGNGVTVNVGSYRYRDPFNMVAGASLRIVVDWGEKESYWSILPGGNSGNFLSNFYDNQIPGWLAGELKKVEMFPKTSRKRIVFNP